MKLIGITGKMGSGKTTLSNMLQEYPGVATIHVDELVDAEKEEKFSGIMDKDKSGNPIVVKRRLKNFIYNNKITFKAFMKFKSKLIASKLDKQIAEYEEMGIDTVVIDSIYLKYLDIFKRLQVKILMRRDYNERLNSVLERDRDKDMDKERFVIADVPYKKGYYREDIRQYKYVVKNDSMEDLRRSADFIYNREIKRKDIREEFRVSEETRQKNRQRNRALTEGKNMNTEQIREGDNKHENR